MLVTFDTINTRDRLFEVTPRSARLLSEIERRIGRHEGALRAPVSPMLRLSLRVRTIQASLQIEGNTLTEEQVTAVLEGRRVSAPERDLREVRNAIVCYEKLPKWAPNILSANLFLRNSDFHIRCAQLPVEPLEA